MHRLLMVGIPALLLLAQIAGAADAKSAPFTRVVNEEGVHALQIASRRLKLTEGSGPDIVLVGVSHIGEKKYYQQLQALLDNQGVVLFEGVGAGDDSPEESAEETPERSLQSSLARSLGLVFQLEAVDYKRPHFKNSDLSLQELARLFRGERGEPARPAAESPPALQEEGGSSAAPGAPDELEALAGMMQGTSLAGVLAQGMLQVVGASPRLQALTRLMMIELLGRLEGDLSEAPGLPPGYKELIVILIKHRNDKVLADLRRELRNGHASVAVFYGAGHMEDLERRIGRELGYQPAETEWFTAFSVDIPQSGLSRFELRMVGSLVRSQLQMLQGGPARPEAPREQPVEAPAAP